MADDHPEPPSGSSPDSDLLARLNALRPTTVSLDHTRPNLSIPSTLQTPDTLLSDRLRALRNGGGVGGRSTASVSHLPPSDQHLTFGVLSDASAQTASAISSLDSPIVEIDDRADRKLAREALDFARGGSHDVPVTKSHGWPSGQGLKVPTPEDVIRHLREEAADTLSDSDELLKSEGKHNIPKNAGSRDSDAGDSPAGESDAEKSDDEDEDRDLEQEAREAEEILARLLDEAHLEERDEAANQQPPPPPQSTNPPSPDRTTTNDPLTLPSTPSTLLSPPDPPDPETLAFANSITARMAALQNPTTIDALGMPSAPSTAPVTSSRGVPSKPAPEPDTACVICYDNATVLCRGCEDSFGDAEEALYCARCWKEGHLGTDAGVEERKHEWIKFKRPT
ncbi:hypothetical protein VE02_08250 [Pseudogymnoascus sp. 03VT05]|nr:hypothetical protein VE02_08250 [Pseudogymnoascus sp. 03VT05]